MTKMYNLAYMSFSEGQQKLSDHFLVPPDLGQSMSAGKVGRKVFVNSGMFSVLQKSNVRLVSSDMKGFIIPEATLRPITGRSAYGAVVKGK